MAAKVRRIEDGPYGGTPLMVGEDQAGETITAPHSADGQSWGAVRTSLTIPSLKLLYALSLSPSLSLAGVALSKTSHVQIDVLEAVGRMWNWYHIDINGPLPRGPFRQDFC